MPPGAQRQTFDTKLATIRSNLPVKIPVSRDDKFVCEVTLGSYYDYPSHLQYYVFHTLENDEQYLLYKNLEEDPKLYANIYDKTKIDYNCQCSLDDAYDRARGKSEPLMLVAGYLRESQIHHHHFLLDAYGMLTAIAKFLVG